MLKDTSDRACASDACTAGRDRINGRVASINIDIDCGIGDAVSNRRTLADYSESGVLSIYQTAIPRFLECLAKHRCRATFFIIGQTARLRRVGAILRKIHASGHEISSHTWSHPKDLIFLPPKQIDEEVYLSKTVLEDTIGERVVGFRAPGYAYNERIVDLLMKHGYLYSSSVNNSVIYNAAKWLFSSLKVSRDIKRMFPINWRLLVASGSPYFPSPRNCSREGKQRSFLEIPISTDFIRLLPAVPWSLQLLTPPWLQGMYWNHMIGHHDRLNIEFHDFEFSTAEELTAPESATSTHDLMRQVPVESRLRFASNILFKLQSTHRFLCLKDMAAMVIRERGRLEN